MKGSQMNTRISGFRVPSVLFFTALLSSQASANSEPTSSVEFHAYGRLGITTNEKLTSAGKDQGDGSFGLPTSRHIRDTNYLRVQSIGRASSSLSLNLEAQFENLPHLTNSWNGTGVNLRNAYLQTTISPDADLWFGARRLEFEDVRLFDKFPLSDTTFYGVGSQLQVAGTPTTIAVGFKNQNSTLNIIKNEADVLAGNAATPAESRSTSIFLRSEYSLGANAALRPTLILDQSGQTLVDGAPVDSYRTINSDTKQVTTTTLQKKTLSGKLGAVLSHWGNDGWGNHFIWLQQRAAQGTSGGSQKDTLLGFASSGDYEGWSAHNIGLMYGLMLEHTQFKVAQKKFSVVDSKLVENGTSKSNTVIALGLQPVYYINDRLHAALDLNHTRTTKVGADSEKPNMTFVTPILRYASNKTALATPQFFTSFTYGMYETKARKNATGTPSANAFTTQTGCEFWF